MKFVCLSQHKDVDSKFSKFFVLNTRLIDFTGRAKNNEIFVTGNLPISCINFLIQPCLLNERINLQISDLAYIALYYYYD